MGLCAIGDSQDLAVFAAKQNRCILLVWRDIPHGGAQAGGSGWILKAQHDFSGLALDQRTMCPATADDLLAEVPVEARALIP